MWLSPPDNLTLADQEVHLWLANLDACDNRLRELGQLLSADELDRADKFYFERHRRRFTIARGTLRVILARYLTTEPQQVRFEYGLRGKPSLATDLQSQGLQFNVSHSQDLALYGFTRDRRIGVDLEYLRPLPDAEQIAKRFFCAREFNAIRALPESERQIAFFRGWTAKEAYLKATGDGLGGSLDAVEVSLTPNTPVRLLSVRGDERVGDRWRLHDLVPAPDYVATVAVEGRDWEIECWQS